MFDYSSYLADRIAPYRDRLRNGSFAPPSVYRGGSGFDFGFTSRPQQRLSPAPAEADQNIAQSTAVSGASTSINRAQQINQHSQRVRIVIDPDVIRQLAGGSPAEEMRIKNRLRTLFAGLHGNFSNDQQHDVAFSQDGSMAVNSRARIDNNPQFVTLQFRNLDGSSELQGANNLLSLSASNLNDAGLAPIKATQLIDQGAFADNQSRSVNNLRQSAEKEQVTEVKVDDDVMGTAVDDFFQNLIEVINFALFGDKDGPDEPPVTQDINQSAGAANNSLALNNGQQRHRANQEVTLYIADFDKSRSDLTNDFGNSPASRFARRTIPRGGISSANLRDYFA